MTLLLTYSTETPLPELPLPLDCYLGFTLTRGDARWRLFGIGGKGYAGVQILGAYLPEEFHLGRAVLHKLQALHRLHCRLMGVDVWR